MRKTNILKVLVVLLLTTSVMTGCGKNNTITFKTNGGSIVETQKVKNGRTIKKPADPTKEGYVFEGWYLNGEEYNFDTEVTSDATLVAKWRQAEPGDPGRQDSRRFQTGVSTARQADK